MENISAINNSSTNKDLFQDFEEEINILLDTFVNGKLLLGEDWNLIGDP